MFPLRLLSVCPRFLAGFHFTRELIRFGFLVNSDSDLCTFFSLPEFTRQIKFVTRKNPKIWLSHGKCSCPSWFFTKAIVLSLCRAKTCSAPPIDDSQKHSWVSCCSRSSVGFGFLFSRANMSAVGFLVSVCVHAHNQLRVFVLSASAVSNAFQSSSSSRTAHGR